MGHTLDEWKARISAILRDPAGRDIAGVDIDEVGVRPALADYSVDVPRVVWAEVAGSGVDNFALPSGWLTGYSRLKSIEYPARQSPPVLISSWRIGPSTSDVDTDRIWLDASPAASEWVRFQFTAPWPFPTATASDDQVDDVAYEAVCRLAAAYACDALAAQASRHRDGALPTDLVDGTARARDLAAQAERFRDAYRRIISPRRVVFA